MNRRMNERMNECDSVSESVNWWQYIFNNEHLLVAPVVLLLPKRHYPVVHWCLNGQIKWTQSDVLKKSLWQLSLPSQCSSTWNGYSGQQEKGDLVAITWIEFCPGDFVASSLVSFFGGFFIGQVIRLQDASSFPLWHLLDWGNPSSAVSLFLWTRGRGEPARRSSVKGRQCPEVDSSAII